MAPDVRGDERAFGGHLQTPSSHVVQRAGGEVARDATALHEWIGLGVDENDSVPDAAIGREAEDLSALARLVALLLGVVDDAKPGHRATIRNSPQARHAGSGC